MRTKRTLNEKIYSLRAKGYDFREIGELLNITSKAAYTQFFCGKKIAEARGGVGKLTSETRARIYHQWNFQGASIKSLAKRYGISATMITFHTTR